MKNSLIAILSLSILLSAWACRQNGKRSGAITFKEDLDFLTQYTEGVVLSDSTGKAKLIAVPAWQGRVMTSTANGDDGTSFGWINRELISSGQIQEHINVFGGEDRFWLGPEGGQFSIFFKKDDPFDLEHWYVPACIDTEPYRVVDKQPEKVLFRKTAHLINYSGTEFDVEIEREVRLYSEKDISGLLGIDIPPDVKKIGYVSVNALTNSGLNPWTKETGLLSIWILGMFNPSPETTVIIPFNQGEETDLGPLVNDAYFGKVPADRLIIDEGVLFFKGDGQYRSKIGLNPRRCRPILGSYDAGNQVLTVVSYTLPEGASDYVNSMWELQDFPYKGDVINSYNDGPPEPGGKPLGPFYELETSSPAAGLNPGEKRIHEHRTFHFQGAESALDQIARHLLGVDLERVKSAFGTSTAHQTP